MGTTKSSVQLVGTNTASKPRTGNGEKVVKELWDLELEMTQEHEGTMTWTSQRKQAHSRVPKGVDDNSQDKTPTKIHQTPLKTAYNCPV